MPRASGAPLLLTLGVALFGASLGLLWLSDRFALERIEITRDPLILVALLMSAGGLYLLLPAVLPRVPRSHGLLAFAVGLGLAMRLALMPSTPVLEDDYHRYLWDGGVLAHGVNPYATAPAEAAAEHPDLTARSGDLPQRINHPDLRTIYPLVAQAGFALAHLVAPWDLTAWRGLLLLADLVTLGLLLAILRRLGRAPLWALLYWWNPLVVSSLFNAGHMDGLLPPFLLASLLAMLQARPLWATAGLVLAAGVKLWPLLLLPLAWRPLLAAPRHLALTVGLATAGVAALAAPVLVAGLDRSSGFVAYGASWAMNDAFFLLVSQLATWLFDALGPTAWDPAQVTRAAIAAGLTGLALWLARAPAASDEDLVRRALILVAALFLTVPAQFPWYYVWLVPFLALRPSWALLLPTLLLPLYFLRFPLADAGREALFDSGVVWLEWLPVWALLALGWLRTLRPADADRMGLAR